MIIRRQAPPPLSWPGQGLGWDKQHHLFLESAKRVADYARFLTRANIEEVGHTALADREAREWKQLYTRAAERDGQQYEAGLRHGWAAFADAAHKELAAGGVAQIYDRIADLKARGPADGD